MKSLKELSWNVDEPTYRADPALSQSNVSKYNREGFEHLDTLFDEESSPALTFGSMVDSLLLGEKGEFESRFFVCSIPEISEDYKKVALAIKEDLGSIHKSLYDVPDKTIVEYLDKLGIYQNNWKAETKAGKIREGANTYYQMLLQSNGREIISNETYQDVMDCVNAALLNEATSFYFAKDNPFDKIERFKQLKFKAKYDGIDIRGMLDLVVVDHKNKTIQPCDLKTTSEEEYNFPRSFIKWNYYIQAGMYLYLLKANLNEDYKDYKILPFKFIVVSKKTKRAIIWEWNQDGATVDFDIETGTNRSVKIKYWGNILKELYRYLKERPKTPDGVSLTDVNSILCAIKKW